MVHQVGFHFQRILLKALQLCLVKRFQFLDVFLPNLLVELPQQAVVTAAAGWWQSLGGYFAIGCVSTSRLLWSFEILIPKIMDCTIRWGRGLVVALNMIYLSSNHHFYLHILLWIFKF